MKVKTMTPVIDDLCALHFTIPDILLCTDESRIKLDVSGVDNRRLRQIILVNSSPNFFLSRVLESKEKHTLAYLIVVGCQINVHEGKWGENTKSYSSVSNSSSPYAKYFGMIFPVARSYWDPYDFQKNILQLRRTKFFFKYEGFFNLKTNCSL